MKKDPVLVTGAAGQLGEVVVKTLVAAGYQVVAVGHSRKPERDVPGVTWYTADLTSEAAVSGLFEQIITGYPEIAAGIFLAGGYRHGGLATTGLKELMQLFDLNFFTAYHLSRKLFLNMQQQARGGRLVFMGSAAGLDPATATGSVAYALSKSLLFRLSEVMSREGITAGIVSAVVVPATIDTASNRKAMPLDDRSYWVSPEAVADAILEAIQTDHPKPVIAVAARD